MIGMHPCMLHHSRSTRQGTTVLAMDRTKTPVASHTGWSRCNTAPLEWMHENEQMIANSTNWKSGNCWMTILSSHRG